MYWYLPATLQDCCHDLVGCFHRLLECCPGTGGSRLADLPTNTRGSHCLAFRCAWPKMGQLYLLAARPAVAIVRLPVGPTNRRRVQELQEWASADGVHHLGRGGDGCARDVSSRETRRLESVERPRLQRRLYHRGAGAAGDAGPALSVSSLLGGSAGTRSRGADLEADAASPAGAR